MGRPRVQIDDEQLRALCRMKPTLDDCAAFFKCSVDSIEKYINRKYDLTFAEFREQNLVHTRFALVRTAVQKAMKGDNLMLLFTLKNLCGWKDRYSDTEDGQAQQNVTIALNYNPKGISNGQTAETEQRTIDVDNSTDSKGGTTPV